MLLLDCCRAFRGIICWLSTTLLIWSSLILNLNFSFSFPWSASVRLVSDFSHHFFFVLLDRFIQTGYIGIQYVFIDKVSSDHLVIELDPNFSKECQRVNHSFIFESLGGFNLPIFGRFFVLLLVSFLHDLEIVVLKYLLLFFEALSNHFIFV